MGSGFVTFGKLLPKLGKGLETGIATNKRVYQSIFTKECSLLKNEFGEGLLKDCEHVIRRNAQRISELNEYTQNMILNVQSSRLRNRLINFVLEAEKVDKKGYPLDSNVIGEIVEGCSLLDVNKDKRVIEEVDKALQMVEKKFCKINAGTFEEPAILGNDLGSIRELAHIPSRSRGEVMNIESVANYIRKEDRFLQSSYYTEAFNESMKRESLVNFLNGKSLNTYTTACDVEHTKEFDNFLYSEYYLKRHPFGYGAKESLERINHDYGTKTFVPLNATDEEAEDILREFHDWNNAGGSCVKYEKVLNFDCFARFPEDSAAGLAELNPNNITIQPWVFRRKYHRSVLRHEKLHLNDRNECCHFGKFGKDGQYDFTEGGKILTEKTWYRDEFRKAGLSDDIINYAYTNRAEFIAVAAQGDYTKYSEEFKQVLIDLGIPEWFFKIRRIRPLFNA